MSTSITNDNNRPQNVAQSTRESYVVCGYPCSPPAHNAAQPNPATARGGTVYPLAVDGATAAQSNRMQVGQANEEVALRKDLAYGIILIISFPLIMLKIAFVDNLPHNPKIHIHSAVLSPFNVVNSQKSAQWEIGILLKNPNWLVGIGYDNFHESVFYKTEYLAGTNVSAIHQPPKGLTLVAVSTQLILPQQNNSTIASFIDMDIAHGRIGFDVKLTATVTSGRTLLTDKKIRVIDALCRGVEIEFPSNATNGTMQGLPRPCMVNVSAYLKN